MKALKETKRPGSARTAPKPPLALLKEARPSSAMRLAPKPRLAFSKEPERPDSVITQASPPRALLKAARDVAANAYAPYSGFRVGAAVETSDGRTFVGANMENASYGLTMCAEVGALQAASSAGALGKIRRMAVVGGPMKPSAGYKPKATAPCGRCRQLISEAAMHGGHEIEVWFADLDRKVVQRRTSSELLPDAFDATNLK
jgi:cytidine deaminase